MYKGKQFFWHENYNQIQMDTSDFIHIKASLSVHLFYGDYLSIPSTHR